MTVEDNDPLASKPAVPEGWKLVPVELTEHMLDEADFAMQNHVGDAYTDADGFDGWYQPVWKAILAASPTAPAQSCGDAEQSAAPMAEATDRGSAPWPGCSQRVCHMNGACWDAGGCLKPAVATPLMQWQAGAGLLWDVYVFGRWAKRIVSPIEWDAHTVYLDMQRAGYSKDIEIRLVSASTKSSPEEPVALPRASEQADEAAPDALGDAARAVIIERQRQMSVEGWTPEHDDEHEIGELARAAACYAANATGFRLQSRVNIWPWDKAWWKPTTPRRDLVKAAALILAEIERIDRKDSK